MISDMKILLRNEGLESCLYATNPNSGFRPYPQMIFRFENDLGLSLIDLPGIGLETALLHFVGDVSDLVYNDCQVELLNVSPDFFCDVERYSTLDEVIKDIKILKDIGYIFYGERNGSS